MNEGGVGELGLAAAARAERGKGVGYGKWTPTTAVLTPPRASRSTAQPP